MSVVVSCFACAIVTVLLHVAWCSNPAPESRSSLLEFYDCADGASWYNNTNWNTSANVCEWYGIECSGRAVTGIKFNENVRYPWPTSCLQSLTRIPLQRIVLKKGTVFGNLPSFITEFMQLRYLDLSSNLLSDAIPTELGLLGQLWHLDLSFNSLSDAIPTELGLLGQLWHLDLSSNSLSEAIPTELGLLGQLWHLDLTSNSLSEAIPTELGLLGQLWSLDLSSNSLSDAIPTELGLLGELRQLDLSSNSLSDAIPTELGLLGNLDHLDLSSNLLSDAIPTEIGLLGNLDHLDLSSNLLSDAIPTELGQMNSLSYLFLFGNRLSSFPVELLSIPIKTLDLHSNDIHGMPLCWREIQVANFNLASNPLNTSIYSLMNFMIFGAVLNSIRPRSALVSLDVSNCSLSGTIPSLRDYFPEGFSFDFSRNFGIWGSLPDDLTKGPPVVLIVEGLNLTSNDPHSEPLTLEAVEHHDNYKCPVIDYKSQGSLSAVHGLDPSYFAYRGCVCLPPLIGTPPNCIAEDNTILVAAVTMVVVVAALTVFYWLNHYCKSRRERHRFEQYMTDVLKDYPNLTCLDRSSECGKSKPLVNPEWNIDYGTLRLANELASGAKGCVRAGQWRTAPVAVKVYTADSLQEGDLKGLEEETHIHCKLRHPNVVQLYGFCSDPPCIVMELMDWGSLYAVIHNRPDLLQPALSISRDVARGMSYLHSGDILHRDLKSLNVLLNSSGVCKIGDFGESRRQHGTLHLSHAVGTVLWMAPENLNDCRFTKASDVYSFGVVLYEVLTRKTPPKVSGRDIFWKAEPFVGCDPALVSLMRACLAEDPKKRPTFDLIVSRLELLMRRRDGNESNDVVRETAAVGSEVDNIDNNINDGNGNGQSTRTDSTLMHRVRTQRSSCVQRD